MGGRERREAEDRHFLIKADGPLTVSSSMLSPGPGPGMMGGASCPVGVVSSGTSGCCTGLSVATL